MVRLLGDHYCIVQSLMSKWIQERIAAGEAKMMNNSHNERMTKEVKEDALGETLAKAKQMSLPKLKPFMAMTLK